MQFIKNVSNSILVQRLYISKFFSGSPRKFWVCILKGKSPVLVLTESKSSSCNALYPTNLITCSKIKVVTYLHISHCASFPGSSHIPALSPYIFLNIVSSNILSNFLPLNKNASTEAAGKFVILGLRIHNFLMSRRRMKRF